MKLNANSVFDLDAKTEQQTCQPKPANEELYKTVFGLKIAFKRGE